MTIVPARSFASYYAELTKHQPSVTDLLKDVCRDELAGRRRIEKEETADLADMLHIRGVWLTDKRLAQKGRLVPKGLDPQAAAVWRREHEIWFPALQPKSVQAPAPQFRGRAFPRFKFNQLVKEEEEVRSWLQGVEEKRWRHIMEDADASMYQFTCFEETRVKEERARRRIEKDQEALFAVIRKNLFLKAPPAYFRQKVIERYGKSEPLALENKKQRRQRLLQEQQQHQQEEGADLERVEERQSEVSERITSPHRNVETADTVLPPLKNSAGMPATARPVKMHPLPANLYEGPATERATRAEDQDSGLYVYTDPSTLPPVYGKFLPPISSRQR